MNNFCDSTQNSNYPRLTSQLEKNRAEALSKAIAVIDGEIPNNTPSTMEKRVAMTIFHMNLDASKNHPPLPSHIQALRDAKRKPVSSKKSEVDYYGGVRRPGQYLGD